MRSAESTHDRIALPTVHPSFFFTKNQEERNIAGRHACYYVSNNQNNNIHFSRVAADFFYDEIVTLMLLTLLGKAYRILDQFI